MKRKLTLHIGTEKTGTTSIQNTLKANYDNLNQLGILYPKCFKLSNHVEMAVCFQTYNPDSELYSVVGLSNNKSDVENFKVNFLKKLEREIIESNCEHVVISNEHLHSRIASLEEIENIYHWASSIFDEIEVSLYLRKQSDLAISHFSTAIKSGSTITNPFPHDVIDSYYYNYQILTELWGSKFKQLTVRAFSRNSLEYGDVVKDFLYKVVVIDEPSLNKFEYPNDSNISLGIRALAFLSYVNQKIPLIENGRLNPLRRRLVSYLENSAKKDKNLVMPYNIISEFQDLFKESNKSCKYISDEVRDYLLSKVSRKESTFEEFSLLLKDTESHQFTLDLWLDSIRFSNFAEVRNSIFQAEIALHNNNREEAIQLLSLAESINPQQPIVEAMRKKLTS